MADLEWFSQRYTVNAINSCNSDVHCFMSAMVTITWKRSPSVMEFHDPNHKTNYVQWLNADEWKWLNWQKRIDWANFNPGVGGPIIGPPTPGSQFHTTILLHTISITFLLLHVHTPMTFVDCVSVVQSRATPAAAALASLAVKCET